MGTLDTPAHITFGGQYPMRAAVAEVVVPVGETSASVETSTRFRGTVEKIEIIPGSPLNQNAVIRVYESNTLVDEAHCDYCLNYTVPESASDVVIYPMVAVKDNTGTEVSGAYTKYVVNDYLTVSLSNANEGDSATVIIYVRG